MCRKQSNLILYDILWSLKALVIRFEWSHSHPPPFISKKKENNWNGFSFSSLERILKPRGKEVFTFQVHVVDKWIQNMTYLLCFCFK